MFRPLCRLALAACCLLAACKRQEIVIYTAPKEGAAPAEPAVEPDAHGEGAPLDSTPPGHDTRTSLPRVSWKLPEGWSEIGANQVSIANFLIKSDVAQATVSVTPLGGLAGHEVEIVNMWRRQVGAPELSEDDAAKALTPIIVAGRPGLQFEVGTEREGKTSRTVTAMLNRPEGTWFFKLAGDDALVAAQQSAFAGFLKTFEFADKGTAADLPAMGSAAPSPAGGDAPVASFTVPAGWTSLPAGQMQVAKFAVPSQGEAKAEVAVSTFGSDTGGNSANIARWRRQLGMPDIPEEELGAIPKPLDAALPGAVVADLQHEQKRMIGAIVPRGGAWWFYKLVGDTEAVAAARESFLAFAKSPPPS